MNTGRPAEPRSPLPLFLAGPVAEHPLDESEAFELIEDLTVNLVREAHKLKADSSKLTSSTQRAKI